MFVSKCKVGFSSLDADGKIRLSALFDFIQDNTDFHFHEMTYLWDYFMNEKVGMFVVSRQLDIVKLPEYGEELTIKTFTHECKNTYGGRNNLIYSEAGELCVKANSVGAFVDLKTSRPLKIPAEILAQIPIEPKIDMEYLPRKIKIDNEKTPEFCGTFQIRNYHIDANRHVNNARFIDIAQEFLPQLNPTNCEIKQVRIEYKTPASLGDIVRAERCVGEGKIAVRLFNEGVTYAVAEFCLA
ncbi:MAG: thioesterase [Oscillospiraceae bacterium]|nr:thioesterase [Oscillospiraceae bacterium]